MRKEYDFSKMKGQKNPYKAIINEIIFEDGYLSSDDVLKDWSVMIVLSRIDQFRKYSYHCRIAAAN